MELASEKRSRRGPRGPGAAFGGLPGQSRQTDFPLRILVQSDMVRFLFDPVYYESILQTLQCFYHYDCLNSYNSK